MNLDPKAKQILTSNARLFKLPDDFEVMLQDLKVLGRREYQNLLRIHHKYQNMIKNERLAKEKKDKEENKVIEPVDEDAELDKQLEATLLRI